MTFANSAKLVFSLTYNPVIGSFFHPLYSMVNAAVLGHSDDLNQMAGLGLGSLTISLVVLSVTSTFVTGQATLVSQAYGADKLDLCLVYRNRQIYLNTVLYVCLSIPLLFVGSIYELIGQEPEVAAYATKYVWTVLPSVYFFVISQTFAIFSCNQRVTWIPLASTVGGAVVHALAIYLFYYVLDLGFYGVSIATACMFMTRFIMNCGLVLTSKKFKKNPEIKLFSKLSTSQFGDQINLCLMSLAMGVWGWWAFDLFTLIASYMAKEVIAA